MNCTIIAPIAPSQRFKFIFRHLMIGLFQDLNNETPTRGIKHWGLGGYSNLLPRIKFGVTGQESSPQSPTISYRHPLCPMVENPS